MNDDYKVCQDFANKHKVIFEDHGEVGFSRPCVGFIKGNGYLDWRPCRHPDYEEILPESKLCYPPHEADDAYHKHDCLAVLVHDDNYDKAISQLAAWVKSMGDNVEVFSYETGDTGIQALITGIIGYAVRKVK